MFLYNKKEANELGKDCFSHFNTVWGIQQKPDKCWISISAQNIRDKNFAHLLK